MPRKPRPLPEHLTRAASTTASAREAGVCRRADCAVQTSFDRCTVCDNWPVSRDDDIARRLLVEDDDWKYVELTKLDVFNPARRMGMLRRLARYLDGEGVVDRPYPAWKGRLGTTSTCLSAGRRR